MAAFSVGSVVLVRFPFSDLSNSVTRPAIVLAKAGRGDFILCQVTSNPFADSNAIELTAASLLQGSLRRTSYARPGKLFSTNKKLVSRKVGDLKPEVRERIVDSVVALLRAPSIES